MTTVLCHGCFDVLHIGHVRFLHAAKALGTRLIVSITADQFVQKGHGRPVFTDQDRREMLLCLYFVDEVFISYDATGLDAIRTLRPDVYVKGGDYANGDASGRLTLERQEVEAYGGRVVILDCPPRYSSTAILDTIHDLARAV